MPVQTKSIFSSRQFQLATLQALIGVITAFHTAYPLVGWITVAFSIAMMVARWTSTGTPVSLAGGIKIR